jgi:hypothetical protein
VVDGLFQTNGVFLKSCTQIVPTEYHHLHGEVMPTNQFSVTEYYQKMKPSDRSYPGIFTTSHIYCGSCWCLILSFSMRNGFISIVNVHRRRSCYIVNRNRFICDILAIFTTELQRSHFHCCWTSMQLSTLCTICLPL